MTFEVAAYNRNLKKGVKKNLYNREGKIKTVRSKSK